VTQPVTPDNGVYMRIAYAVAVVVYVGYALLLWRRNARLRDRARHIGKTSSSTDARAGD
jgi:hypothetical protein